MEPTLHFDRAEYAARIARARRAMDARGLELLIVSDPSNMAWLTGYDGWSFYVHQCVLLGLDGDPVWYGDTPARHEAIPVRLRAADGESGQVIAVVGRDTNLSTARTPSQLELNYLTTADDLAQMVADGTFPPARHPGETTSAPRVGDGLVRLDANGKVTYASPNAQSAYRRLGMAAHLVGEDLSALTGRLADDPLDGSEAAGKVLAALRGESPPRWEVEARGATVLMRALPLMPAGVPIGALVLARDITEIRRRERALVTKDATIREIHHRVKNNLQTVAALLRLQARRVSAPQARAALEESVRRVASIALVHETLSMSSDEAGSFFAPRSPIT